MHYEKKGKYKSYLELKLSPKIDQYGLQIDNDFEECPILFKLLITGRWSVQSWLDIRDVIRVIGEFNKENSFTLRLDDETEDLHLNDKASMIIVEP